LHVFNEFRMQITAYWLPITAASKTHEIYMYDTSHFTQVLVVFQHARTDIFLC